MPGVCPRCNREVFFAEEKLALGKVWHTFCFSCRNCRKLLNNCNVVTHLGELFCKSCYVRLSTANYEIKETQHSPAILTVSTEKSLNCHCSDRESSIGNASLNRDQYYRSDKCRLRGGGSEAEEINVCLGKEKGRFLENECADLNVVNSMTTICDTPPSPTAVTTCALPLESQKNNTVAKDYRFESQKQETDQFESKTSFSNNEVNITEAQLSTDKTQVTTVNRDNKINEYDPVYEFNGNSHFIIPSRRKFAYPPVPPPRIPLPSRRRVSFHDVVFGEMRDDHQDRVMKMQNVHRGPCCNNDDRQECNNSYDIWQADDSVDKNDGGYENVNVNHIEDSGRMHFERSASDCDEEDTPSKHSGNEGNREQDRCCVEDSSESRSYRITNEKDDALPREDTTMYGHQSGLYSSNELDENERMRGGCVGPCGSRLRPLCGAVKVETACFCKREPEQCRNIATSYTTCSSNVQPIIERRCCCSLPIERPICKKPIIRCRQSCEPQGGGGGCCGGGCRGGCGKPGQTCLPAKPCVVPSCRPCSPCSPPRSCPPQVICYCGRKCGNCCGSGGGTMCGCRSKNPGCRVRTRRCCSTDRANPIDQRCCRPKTACECFGGGLDCQRCGRKVYQAEMQIVSGTPFHNTCFSCYCCRKPLESLTYQENCGEIYCKQCYVRNFGPQGYGYGVGPGTLQTPM
ncbi:hypothetical protein QLX08_009028 [Tetragonisca angustula]|uniref:LIM zinc-binding domain-containing protein n=1 Tax=Tetragonisca angustula TaxID=166442 RepID=A0AAW0ZHH3_9HYME